MNATVQYFQGRNHNGNISKVYIRLRSEYAYRLYRKKQVIMHGTLPHDFLNNNDLLLSRSSELIKGLRIDKKTFLRLLQCLTDLFGNDIRCRMRCQWTRTLHIGLFFNRHIGLDEDFSLIRASGTPPHNIFIKIAFRRSEFSDLYPVGVRSGNHHDHAV